MPSIPEYKHKSPNNIIINIHILGCFEQLVHPPGVLQHSKFQLTSHNFLQVKLLAAIEEGCIVFYSDNFQYAAPHCMEFSEFIIGAV